MNFKFDIDFVRYWKWYLAASSIILLLGVVSLLAFGLNLSVDFQGGTRLDIYTVEEVPQEDVVAMVEAQGVTPESVQRTGNNGEYIVMRFGEELSKDVLANLRVGVQAAYGEEADIQESTVSPLIARELARKALIGVLMASVGIIIYVTVRFEYRFAVSAILALFHDALMVVVFFSFFRREVDLTFIAAVLTVIGYSVNDTIVIFDRIRWNLKSWKIKQPEDIKQVVNASIKETLPRSINTSLTVVIVALGLFLLGAASIRNFSLALLIGLISGAYSSLFIAAQLWMIWRIRDLRREKKKVGSQAS